MCNYCNNYSYKVTFAVSVATLMSTQRGKQRQLYSFSSMYKLVYVNAINKPILPYRVSI